MNGFSQTEQKYMQKNSLSTCNVYSRVTLRFLPISMSGILSSVIDCSGQGIVDARGITLPSILRIKCQMFMHRPRFAFQENG